MITIATPRGRLLEETVELFQRASIEITEIIKDSRKLIFEFKQAGIKLLIVRPTDVGSYVEYGAADCGIVGKDTLIEQDCNLYEPLDLGIGKCKMVVAAPKGFGKSSKASLRIATKYPKIASDFYNRKGITTEVIKLYGSVELAPIVGLCDAIVDLTATGETLKKNDLEIVEVVEEISAKFVVNKVSLKIKSREIKDLIVRLEKAR
ncbi:MAG: ATP phosphoribosyltransferase [Candidatus Dadabacteria bacterium]|nr:ATP phosphoribosyltransferase [Candidatus Dadabacteria bacterium]MCY4262368.1 ATP phosphoribosyltransferase [Candidatus Dadabacteria bacterium]